MLTSIIRFVFIYMSCIHIYSKSLPISKISFSKECIISFIMAISTYLLDLYSTELYYVIPLLCFWIITSILNSSPQQSFITITIAFTISICLFAIFSFIIALIIVPIFEPNMHFPIAAFISGLIQFVTTRKLLTVKRFQKGISFLFSSISINLLTILCLTLICFPIHTIKDNPIFHLRFAWLLSFAPYLFTLAFLIYWWQAQITKSYRRTLELRELESMRTEMAELKLKMQEVMEENEKLARITHRDNTLISTLKNSTVNYLMTDFTNSTDAIAAREKLIANINALSAGRTSLPDNFNEKKARTFDTGVPLLDELLHQMDITAIEKQITFSVHMGTILSDFVPAHVSSDDLVHTVDDLLKNAFKATTTCDKRVVQLQFYKLGKHFVIEVADSGIPFEVRSLVNMGIEKLTTYDDGSGIGLVDIWNTKAKYGATYHIEEYAVATPFTKKISLTFDKKNRYSIRTWRKNEIAQMSKRADLQVYEDLE